MCWRLHGRWHGRCFATNAMTNASGLAWCQVPPATMVGVQTVYPSVCTRQSRSVCPSVYGSVLSAHASETILVVADNFLPASPQTIACSLRKTLLTRSSCQVSLPKRYRLKTSSPPPCLLSSQPICSLISTWQWTQKPARLVSPSTCLPSPLDLRSRPACRPLSSLSQQHSKSPMIESAIAKFSVKID